MRRGRYVWISFGLMVIAGAAAVACGDDASPGDSATPDGGSTADSGARPDGSTPNDPDAGDDDAGDAGLADAGDAGLADAGEDADAAPTATVTTSVGPTGLIELDDVNALALFYEDDTIVHVSDAPECVGHLRSETKPASVAGTITIGGEIVGAVGGPPATVDVAPDPADPSNLYYSGDLIFPADDLLSLQIEKDSTTVFPSIPVQTLKTPPAGTVVVSVPEKPATGDLDVPSDKDLAFAWTPPASTTGQSLYVRYGDLVANGRTANIMCRFPLAVGSGRIPASLLSHVRTWLGGEVSAMIVTNAGGATEVAVGGASYVIFTARVDSTNHSFLDDFIPAKLK